MNDNKQIASKTGVVIVAGGSGARFGGDVPKQYLSLAGIPIIARSISAFDGFAKYIQVVIRHNDIESYNSAIAHLKLKDSELLPVVFGAEKRQGSVLRGLIALEKHEAELVLIHDAARPLVSPAVIEAALLEAKNSGAALPGYAVKDTLKMNKKGVVEKTISRRNLFHAQTPQAFNFAKILSAHKRLQDFDYTDDASLIEALGEKVALTQGDEKNIKITTKEDLKMAETLLGKTPDIRVGSGFDVHQFEEGDGVILGGIKIPHNKKLKGHSDADAVLHAITDAILGAIGHGDIGEHFPPSDMKWKNAASDIFLIKAAELASHAGFIISNVDVTIMAEEPKISAFKKQIAENIEKILHLESGRVNIKATTTEKLGFIGRSEGLAAQAITTLIK